MDISWAINRVSSMSVPEVTFRIREQVRRGAMRGVKGGWVNFAPEGGGRPVIPTLRERFLNACSPQHKAAIEASVDSFLSGRFEALGQSWPARRAGDEFPPEMWHVDPVTGRSWPSDSYCFDVNYRDARDIGDVKYVWQLNRLQFLPPIAAAVALKSRPHATSAVSKCLASWMAANVPFQGVCWNSGIELALRSVSVIVASSLCPDDLDDKCWSDIRGFLAAHLFWLKRYPSRYSSANNHCVAEALAGYMIGSLMPELPDASAHARQCRELLQRETLLQVNPDGSAAEQSLVYGSFTAEMILLACLLGQCLGEEFPSEVLARLVAFADGVSAFALPSGETPDIGDDDDTRVITLCHEREAKYPASVARAISAFCGVPAPPIVPPQYELRDIIFGPVNAEREPKDGVLTMPHGGYSIVTERRAGRSLKLIMDHGPLGYLSIAAHGHADANSIILSLDHRPIIVDPGTYLYHSGGPWRNWFRSTRAHSTLNLAGRDQSVMTGAFNWGRKAKARLVSFVNGPDWVVVAEHDGYFRSYGVIHERRVEARADGIEIRDRLLPDGSAQLAEVVFQFAPELKLDLCGLGCRISDRAGSIGILRFDQEGSIEVQRGQENSFLGWISPSFGHLLPAARLTWSGVLGPAGLTTIITWSPPGPTESASTSE